MRPAREERPVRPAVTALVAARNEEGTVGQVVKELGQLPGVDDIVVVADGATDGTAEEARAAGARVLIRPRPLGKGGAVESALDLIPRAGVYLFVDGDLGETASEAGRLLEEVRSGRLDLAIGRLPAQGGGGFGLVKRFAAWLIGLLTGFRAEEPLSGQRAITAQALDGCRPLARGFGLETAMTIDAARLGFRIGEIPVAMRHRATGRGPAGFAHRGRQGLDILRAVVPRALGLR